VEEEVVHIKQCADANKMVINWAKTNEVYFDAQVLTTFSLLRP